MWVCDVVCLGCIFYYFLFLNWSVQDDEVIVVVLQWVVMLEKSEQGWLSFFGGEWQWVYIVCVLVQSLSEILLDELINYLDIYYQMQLMQLISELLVISIVVIYDFNYVVMFCDLLIVMQQGQIFVSGMLEEILFEGLLWDVFWVKIKIEIFFYYGKKYIYFIVQVGWICFFFFCVLW